MAGPTTEKQIEELLKDPNGLRDHLTSVLGDTMKDTLSPLVKSQVTEAVEKALAEQKAATEKALAEQATRYEARLAELKVGSQIKRLPMTGAAYNPNAPGAGLDNEWKGQFEFLKALFAAGMRGAVDPRLKVLSEGDAGAGGYLVPEVYRADLMAVAIEEALIRPRATVIPMGAETIKIPAIRDTSHASSVFGGIVAYWTAESGSLTESEPSFRQIALNAKKLTGYTTASNELLADSAIALEGLINRLFPLAITWYEEKGFFSGTGVGEPLGLVGSPCRVAVAKESGQAADTVVAENLDKMYSRMLPSSRNRGIWIANSNVFPQLAAMSRNVGTGGAPVWVTNMAGGPPTSIYGRPVFFSEHCETVGDEGDIYFVDLFYYLVGDRQALSMAASPHVRFTNDETVWRFVERLDGRMWLDSAITPENGGDTISPLVTLAARA